MECTSYDEFRDKCFDSLLEFINFDTFEKADIFTYIMCATDYEILKMITKFIKNAFDKRSRESMATS